MSANAQTERREWGGPPADKQIGGSLKPGTYPVYLDKIEEIDTKFGPKLRLNWSVDVDGERRTVSELCSEAYGSRSKFMKRIAAINNVDELDEGASAANLSYTGWAVALIKEDSKGYPEVAEVMAPFMVPSVPIPGEPF